MLIIDVNSATCNTLLQPAVIEYTSCNDIYWRQITPFAVSCVIKMRVCYTQLRHDEWEATRKVIGQFSVVL